MTTFLGLVRDAVAAALALAILFGAGFSNDQVAGILLLVSTVSALGAWAYSQLKGNKT